MYFEIRLKPHTSPYICPFNKCYPNQGPLCLVTRVFRAKSPEETTETTTAKVNTDVIREKKMNGIWCVAHD